MDRKIALFLAVFVAILCLLAREYKLLDSIIEFGSTFIRTFGGQIFEGIKSGMEL